MNRHVEIKEMMGSQNSEKPQACEKCGSKNSQLTFYRFHFGHKIGESYEGSAKVSKYNMEKEKKIFGLCPDCIMKRKLGLTLGFILLFFGFSIGGLFLLDYSEAAGVITILIGIVGGLWQLKSLVLKGGAATSIIKGLYEKDGIEVFDDRRYSELSHRKN